MEEPLGERAARGVGVLVARTIGLQLLTAGVTVALARILSPGDYGLFAIAQATQMLGMRLAELGIASALLRRPQEPSAAEQRATLTVFLSLGLAMCGIAFLLAFLLLPWSGTEEEGAKVVAVCLIAVPIYACRSVPVMLLERRLGFGRVAIIETGETVAFNAFALAAAVAGLGAYSLAGAIPAAALAGTAVAWRMQPFERGLTRRLEPVRPLIRFGLGLTTLQTVNLGGALAFVSTLTAVGGASLAGFYGLAQRLFAFPTALTSALLRVSFPALSLGDSAERPRRAGRAAILGAVVVGLPLALVAGAADPLILVLFGDRWLPVADLVALGSVAMMLLSAAAIPMTSLALAQGRPAIPVAGAAAQAALLAAGAALFADLGTAEVGAVMATAAAANVAVLAARTESTMRRALVAVAVALGVSAVAAAAGRVLDAGEDFGGLVADSVLVGTVWLALTLVLLREPATAVWRLAKPYLLRAGRFALPAVLLIAAGGAAALALSGDEAAGPRTPAGLAGAPEPFLGVAVLGSGGLAAAVDAYGSVVDIRAPGSAGEAQIAIPHERQNAGTVPPRSGLVIAAGAGGRPPVPAWDATTVEQRYLPRSNVLETRLALGGAAVRSLDGAAGGTLTRRITATGPGRVRVRLIADLDLAGTPQGDVFRPAGGRLGVRDGEARAVCETDPPAAIRLVGGEDPHAVADWRGSAPVTAIFACRFGGSEPSPPSAATLAAADRRWLAQGTGLGPGAPGWARALHDRSLLVLRALSDSRGAMAAGVRDGWSYVWPRDAATGALALAAGGHEPEARRIARFLAELDLAAGARFFADGSHVPDGRPAQGDAGGWARLALRAVGLPDRGVAGPGWRGRPDYGERKGDEGDYVANAIAAGVGAARIERLFGGSAATLVRRAGSPASELDSAVAWAVRPFPRPDLYPAIRRTLRAVGATAGPFGLEPHTRWPGVDPWTAPAAWSAWGEAALGRREAALAHLARLRRSATPAGLLPERVDAASGIPVSTTPLGWSHAFAVLALRQLWPAVRSR